MENPIQDITLDDIVWERKRNAWQLAFQPKIESVFRKFSQTEHRKYALFNMLIGIVLFDLYIVCDYIQAPEQADIFLIMRFGIVTPFCLLSLFAVKLWNLHLKTYYYVLVCIGPTAMCLANTVMLMTMGSGDYRLSYLLGEVVIMLCSVVLCRPDIRTAVGMILVQLTCYHVALFGSNIVEPELRLANIMFAVASGIISVINAYILERINRQAFLLNLRVSLLNQELERQSITDPLTGLGNRRALGEATQKIWASSHAGRVVSMILLDVDHFKSFNDTFGHQAGDRCLSEIGRCVARHVRNAEDLAIRFGGEELVLLLPDTDISRAREMAEALRLAILALSIPHTALGPNVVVSASFGVGSVSTLDSTPTELAANADAALYAAKRNGRNQVWPPLGTLQSARELVLPMTAVA